MGNCAETCVSKYEFSREAQDDYSHESYRRAQDAIKTGKFKKEIAVVEIEGRKGKSMVIDDEEPFAAPLDKMRSLKPAFVKDGGSVTAANSSKINDGAAALIVTSRSAIGWGRLAADAIRE
jgi:acetyl-CoA C-acetyltransferase